jgi:hypothetical protein
MAADILLDETSVQIEGDLSVAGNLSLAGNRTISLSLSESLPSSEFSIQLTREGATATHGPLNGLSFGKDGLWIGCNAGFGFAGRQYLTVQAEPALSKPTIKPVTLLLDGDGASLSYDANTFRIGSEGVAFAADTISLRSAAVTIQSANTAKATQISVKEGTIELGHAETIVLDADAINIGGVTSIVGAHLRVQISAWGLSPLAGKPIPIRALTPAPHPEQVPSRFRG